MEKQNTNIFISWSKQPANDIATYLEKLLCGIFASPNIEFFISSSSITAGERFRNNIDENLENSDFGILILTKDNYGSEWIMFESGALSKKIKNSRIIPILFTREKNKIESPISSFNYVRYSKDEFLKLLISIEKVLYNYGEKDKIKKDKLDQLEFSLNKHWDSFVKGVDDALEKHASTSNVEAIREDIANFMLDENAYDIVLSKRETHLQELLSNLENDTSKRLIIVGGISTTLRSEQTIKAITVWLAKNTESKLFICHENSEVAKKRAQDISSKAFKKKVDTALEIQKRKVEEFNNWKKELLQSVGKKYHKNIHFIEVNKALTVYVTVQGSTMYLTPVLDKRSSDTFTFKLKQTSLITDVLDYISSRIETNKSLVSEINQIKLEGNKL